MSREVIDEIAKDAEAVERVCGGEIECYRELVQRHERRVFAVAWSRLGDANLAEEVTQEAFIRGYRRLRSLGDGARFGGWIVSIARHYAINLGLRRRRELKKRERWALENIACPALSEEREDLSASEILQDLLPQLSPDQRECIVLFYLEGKSGSEAAALVGISETAFRVRLHRARSVLRGRFEEAFTEAMQRLKPTASVSASVMSVVLSPTAVKSAGAGVMALMGSLGKATSVSGIVSTIWSLMIVPIPFAAWLANRSELRNFREPQGFRARLFRASRKFQALWILGLMLFLWAFQPLIGPVIQLGGQEGLRQLFFFLGVLLLLTTVSLGRRLLIIRNRYFRMEVLGAALTAFACLAVGLRLVPHALFFLFVGLNGLIASCGFGQRPNRMDYNLFLREVEGMLPLGRDNPPAFGASVAHGNMEMLAFAGLLGRHWMAIDYQWVAEGLALRMPGVKSSHWALVHCWTGWSKSSRLVLKGNGEVIAECSEQDRRALQTLKDGRIISRTALENRVRSSVSDAWESFRRNEVERSKLTLGEARDEEIFRRSPARTGLGRWRKRFAIVNAIMLAPLLVLTVCKPVWMSGLKPVVTTEAEVRRSLASYEATRFETNSLSKSLAYALTKSLVLPSALLFTPEAMGAIRRDMFRLSLFTPEGDLDTRRSVFLLSWPLWKGLEVGWVGLNDLGLTRGGISEALHSSGRTVSFSLFPHTCNGPEGPYSVDQLTIPLLSQLRWLRDFDLLDLVNTPTLVKQLQSLQITSGEASGGRLPLSNWRDLRGLFYIPNWPALQDTYLDIAALQILGGLDGIDREGCIEAILKLHRGAGYFAPPETDEPWKLQIQGDARDTYCAFESLRILGALDRVHDLKDWKFRTKHASTRSAPQPLTWDEIEAWGCEQRLNEYLAGR